MQQDLITKVIDSLVTTGPVALILAAGLWWQTRGNQSLVKQLNTERCQRLDAMDEEINRQRKRSDDCERDRLALHQEIARLRGAD